MVAFKISYNVPGLAFNRFHKKIRIQTPEMSTSAFAFHKYVQEKYPYSSPPIIFNVCNLSKSVEWTVFLSKMILFLEISNISFDSEYYY